MPATIPTDRAALKINEFCRLYALGRVKAYAEMKEGKLGFKLIGRHRVIPVEAAERWFASLPGSAAV